MVSAFPFRSVIAAVLTCLLIAVAAPAAAGTPTSDAATERAAVRQEMRKYLAAHPGGTAISDNEISYDGGTFIVTLRPPEAQAEGVADCPAGWYCFYEWPNFGYPRGKLSSCGWQSLHNWSWQFRAESAHYNLGSGYVSFYYYDERLFDIGTGNRVRTDAWPYRNWPNYVYRYCPW